MIYRTTSHSRRCRSTRRSALATLLLTLTPIPGSGAECSMSAQGVNFGEYVTADPTPNDVAGTLAVSCTYTDLGSRDVLYAVTLSAGSSGTTAQRKLQSGSDLLLYNLHVDAGRALVWGDGTVGSEVVSGRIRVGPGRGNNTRTGSHTIYGRIEPLQDVDGGFYTDTIVATMSF